MMLRSLLALSMCMAALVVSADDKPPQKTGVVLEPASVGGEPGSVVQVANLIYAGTKTSECFSDHFLRRAEKDSSISTSRRLHSVKLSSEEIYSFPVLIMTVKASFSCWPKSDRTCGNSLNAVGSCWPRLAVRPKLGTDPSDVRWL